MIVIIRSNDLESEPRVNKYVKFLEKENISYHLIGWDREEKNLKKNNRTYYRKKAGYNLRKKGIIYRVFWNFFLLKQLYIKRKDYRIIHACDFDTVLPSLIMKLFGKKVVFDIFDWFSDEVKTGNKFIDKTINLLEKLAFKTSDYVIICEEERKEQIGIKRKDILILPNIPYFSENKEIKNNMKIENDKIIISYVGGFYKNRGLDELIEVIIEFPEKFQLEIAGFGDENLERKIKEYSENFDNINFHGKVIYEEGLSIMKNSDLIYAMYYTVNRNHVYAAPNKFYESLYLETPLLTNKGTIFSKKIEKCNTGFSIKEGKDKLKEFFKNMTLDLIESKKNQQKNIWKKEYEDYVKKFFEKKYIKIIELKKN